VYAGLDLTGDPTITLSTHVTALVTEVQTVTTSAKLRFAQQSIAIRALDTPTPGAYIPEVQVVKLANATGGSFTLSLRNYTTSAVPHSATAAILRQALLGGMGFLSDVSVARTDVSSRVRHFSVTFSSYQGDLPLMVANGSLLTPSSGAAKASVAVASALNGTLQEVQRVTFQSAPTGGQFTLLYRGSSTPALPHNASAAAVKGALEGVPGLGRVAVSKAVSGGIPSWSVTFLDLAGDLPMLTSVSNLWAGNTVRQPRLPPGLVPT
jgi:hypothetical protein